MRVLWITNTEFPDLSEFRGKKASVFGGWMFGLARALSLQFRTTLAVATVYEGTCLLHYEINGIEYFLLPTLNRSKYDVKLEMVWQAVCTQFAPDIVHIHGTEYPHGLACLRANPNLNFVVSIQGLTSVYGRYYLGGLGIREILRSITIRDIVKLDSLFHSRRKFLGKGRFEKEYLVRSKHVIGRTSWDYAHVRSIARSASYHFCNEVLREGFYHADKWSLTCAIPNSIFLSQAAYPIKGLHKVIEAVAILKRDFPFISVRVGGINIFKKGATISGYGNYIRRRIKALNLGDVISFAGVLSEQEMIDEYRRAHVFVCPSSIENSPNSVGEAQILGVPCVCAYVGGIPDMVENGKTGLLYRFEEVEMLAENISTIFKDGNFATRLSFNSIISAEMRHSYDVNVERTKLIYEDVLNSKM